MCERGYLKADSSNLPLVDSIMVMEYFHENHQFVSAEMRGVKMQRSSRENYGDNAVAYVQVKRENNKCVLLGKFTPDHKINATYYKVEIVVNENAKKVELAKCYGCPASEGGCKHAVAFLMWLHRRSEEPSPTETVCYWKKSVLSGATSSKKFVSVTDFGKKIPTVNVNNDVVKEYIEQAKKRKITNSMLRYYQPGNFDPASLFWLKNEYTKKVGNEVFIFENFQRFCFEKMPNFLIEEVEVHTREQSESPLWSEVRYGRVTASKAYDVVKCNTFDGSLLENILGAKLFQTEAMKRGLKLEKSVLEVLTEKTSQKFSKTGIFLSNKCPIVGASSDAINDIYVVEIKSPKLERTVSNYVDSAGMIKPKYYHQIQLQMHLSNRKKALFVVADPNFEKNKIININCYEYDEDFVDDLLKKISNFWVEVIFNKI